MNWCRESKANTKGLLMGRDKLLEKESICYNYFSLFWCRGLPVSLHQGKPYRYFKFLILSVKLNFETYLDSSFPHNDCRFKLIGYNSVRTDNLDNTLINGVCVYF